MAQKWEYLRVEQTSIVGEPHGLLGRGLEVETWVSHSGKKFVVDKKGDPEKLLPTIMNDLGEQGWELVSVESNIFWFKRPKS